MLKSYRRVQGTRKKEPVLPAKPKKTCSKNTYRESLTKYAKGETKFMLLQKISFYVSFLVLILSVIVFSKIMKGIDIFTVTEKLNWLVPSGIGVLYIFTQCVLKKYKKATTSANNILKELKL